MTVPSSSLKPLVKKSKTTTKHWEECKPALRDYQPQQLVKLELTKEQEEAILVLTWTPSIYSHAPDHFIQKDLPHENSWAGRPFPQCSQDSHGPWWGHSPPDPQLCHPNVQWDHPNPWRGQDHQNFQYYPAPQWNQYHPEHPARDYDCGFDNSNFLQRGRSFYRRRSYGKDNSHNSSRVLVEMQRSKKENNSKVKKGASAIPKETKQAQEDSVALVKNTDPLQDKLKGTQTQPNQAAFLPSPVEGQAPSNIAESFHPVVKKEPMLATEVHHSLVASLASAEAPTETMKDSHPLVKEKPVPETRQDMNITSSIDPSSVIEPSALSIVVEPPAPLEINEAILSLGREEDELLESSQPTDHFNHVDAPPAVEIPFLADTTDECQSERKEDLELIQMGGSHEDMDCCQACDALAGGSSALPVVPSDVHSVPVLVSEKETEKPYLWESESSPHAQNFNWSDGGKGWAPEDYQEPSWGVDKAKKCGNVSELERDLVLSCTSFHSLYSCDQNPDTRRVLECHSSSPKSQNSDSKHSSTQRTIKHLRSPLKQGHHSRSSLRRRWHSGSPLRGREITRIDCCSKHHCKCFQNPSRERFQERELLHSYSTHKMHCHHPSKETSKCYRTSHSYSPENSTMKSQTRKRKATHHEETEKRRSTSVKKTKSSTKSQTRKRKAMHHEETEKRRSTSVKKTKSSMVTKNGEKGQASALAVEISVPALTTEHFQPANTEPHELVQLAPSSEDTGFPRQPCAWKEIGTSGPSKIVEDPRSVAVLTRRNQIEQDYLQVILNFAVVATMLLQKEPCMEQALEVALRANMRSVGDYYESMLKNFIDDYDLSETQ